MIDLTLDADTPTPEVDLLGIERATRLLMRMGFSQMEAYEISLNLAGIALCQR